MTEVALPKSRRYRRGEMTTGEAVRSCGDCTACCTTMGVPDYEPEAKLPGVRCGDVCSRGCRRYATRPQSCRDFACIWVQSGLPKWMRPDRIGVVFTTDSAGEVLIGHYTDLPWLKNHDLVDHCTTLSARGVTIALGPTGTGRVSHQFTEGKLLVRPPEDQINQDLTFS